MLGGKDSDPVELRPLWVEAQERRQVLPRTGRAGNADPLDRIRIHADTTALSPVVRWISTRISLYPELAP